MDLVDVARELYAGPAAEFVAARGARASQARADGDRDLARAVAALRRPTTAAWAVNLLVRERPAELAQLVALGDALREAQEALDGDELRELNRMRHRLVAALRADAEGLAQRAGQRLGEAVARQVEATVRAVMTDAGAAAAVRTGLLVRELEATGFEPVDLVGAVAVPDAAPLPGTETPGRDPAPRSGRAAAPRRARRGGGSRPGAEADEAARAVARKDTERAAARAAALEAARADVARAEAARTSAQTLSADAAEAVRLAEERRELLGERLERLRAELRDAERDAERLSVELDDAREARQTASRRVTATERDVDRARAAVARLEES